MPPGVLRLSLTAAEQQTTQAHQGPLHENAVVMPIKVLDADGIGNYEEEGG